MEDTFMELMEDIRCDAGEDIGEGKVFPKRFEDWSQTFFIELLQLLVSSLLLQGLQRVLHAAAGTFLKVATILRLNQTVRAMALLVASHKTLLGKVSNVHCEDQLYFMHKAVSTNHGLSLLTSLGQWMHQQRHCIVV